MPPKQQRPKQLSTSSDVLALAEQQPEPEDELRAEVESEAIRIVQNEKTQWEYSYCYVTPTVAFVMREVIRQCRKNYWGVFDQPVDSKTGREKVWQHVSKAFVDFFIKNVDLDTKDISFVAKHPDAVALTAVIRSRIHASLDEMGFGALLDMTERQIAIDGTAVWETAEVNGKPKVRYVDILNCYIDPAVESIAEAELFTERFVPSVWEFRRMAKRNNWINWEKITGSTMVNRWDGQLNVAAQTSSSTNVPLVGDRLKGLYHVDPTKWKGAPRSTVWDHIDAVIEAYTQLHPLEVRECVEYNGAVIDASYTQYGESQDKNLGIRLAVNIPVGLLLRIEQVDPEVFATREKLHEFMRRYKGFTCARV